MSAREVTKESNRRKILAAARKLLHEGGLEALTMRALAKRAKVSPRTSYNLFGSKTDILLGLLDEPLRQFGQTRCQLQETSSCAGCWLWAAGPVSGPQLVAQIRRSKLLCFLAYCQAALRPELEAELARLDHTTALQ